ncbi:transcriptional regulator [Candidatus Tisiphia endosymbiont of Beris chalybata]|uniref:helix-turn-helix transcriptional regulator n=1 Tax=Candidatus Tisiphia endosymbiont of Beris chalybata TaxID=3066262 RepID=UPI00312C8467
MALSTYIPICDAIVRLMHPLIEIVIHDIESDSIIYMNGHLSPRKVGDPALLDKEVVNNLDQIVYPKINFDGKLVKSISVVLEGKWVLCINADISLFSNMHALSEVILQSVSTYQPKSLFVNDWQEKLHISVHDYLQNYSLSFKNLSAPNKKALVKHLFGLGAFNEKKAADYIAKILDLSRATVFKYLKELRIK